MYICITYTGIYFDKILLVEAVYVITKLKQLYMNIAYFSRSSGRALLCQDNQQGIHTFHLEDILQGHPQEYGQK